MTIELEQEEDGRWIAEAPQIPGALAYGDTQREAISKVESLVLRIPVSYTHLTLPTILRV